MTLRHRKPDPLADVVRSQQEEIKKYKWIESEKVGHDIGFEKALLDWIVKHRAGWRALRQHRPNENRERTNNVAAA